MTKFDLNKVRNLEDMLQGNLHGALAMFKVAQSV